MKNAPDHKTIYDQDCEFLRYQDGLKWSRFQTISLIEGVILYGLYGLSSSLGVFDKRLLIAAGTFLIVLIFVASLIDQKHQDSHLARVKRYEGDSAFKPSLQLGRFVMVVAAILLIVINIFLFCLNSN